MAEGGESRRRSDAERGASGSPFIPIMMMEDLLDKLKLLDYERKFCKAYEIRPLSRHHFALAGDSSEQFYHFASLVCWMLSLQGKQMERVQEYDDPNATVATIITMLKAVSVPTNFPPGRLKVGHGETVLQVLDKLAESSLTATNFKWRQPRHDDAAMESTIDDVVEELVLEDTAEVRTGMTDFDEIADETALAIDASDDDDDDETLGRSDLRQSMLQGSAATQPKEALVSHADATEWRMELERVVPALKVHIRADEKDWRVHSQRIARHKTEIEGKMADTKQQLTKLHGDVQKSLEKMAAREKYINAQLSLPLSEFRKLNDTVAETTGRYNGSSGGVTDLTRELSSMTEELESLKAEMDEYGASMSDAAPLVKLKQSLNRLKADAVDADMRAGVLEHVLTTNAMTKKSKLQRDLNIARPTITSSNYGEFNTV